jgi:hypothetical protein
MYHLVTSNLDFIFPIAALIFVFVIIKLIRRTNSSTGILPVGTIVCCDTFYQWGPEMLVMDMDFRTDTDRKPISQEMTHIFTKKIMRWLHSQGMEGNLSINNHQARLCVMTEEWTDKDYNEFVDKLRHGVAQALNIT